MLEWTKMGLRAEDGEMGWVGVRVSGVGGVRVGSVHKMQIEKEMEEAVGGGREVKAGRGGAVVWVWVGGRGKCRVGGAEG